MFNVDNEIFQMKGLGSIRNVYLYTKKLQLHYKNYLYLQKKLNFIMETITSMNDNCMVSFSISLNQCSLVFGKNM